MNKEHTRLKVIRQIILFVFLTLFVGQIFAFPQLPQDLTNLNDTYNLFNIYSLKEEKSKTVPLAFIISDNGEITNKNITYYDILIVNPGQYPVIVNNPSEKLQVSAKLQNIYFLTTRKHNFKDNCENAIYNYFNLQNLEFEKPYNLDNKNLIVDKILIPRTKEKIIAYLSKNQVTKPEQCLEKLESNKNLVSYPILFKLEAKLIGTAEEIGSGLSFDIKFDPEFLSNIKPITFNVFTRRSPITLQSKYELPRGCENSAVSGQCYITQKDIDEFYAEEIMPQSSIVVNDIMYSILDNFNVVSSFKDNSFENRNTQDLLVDLALKRERFCFRTENEKYNQIIFDVAKAYNLSLEQTFQLWALISEKSNCNYKLNPNLYGFVQLSMKNRDSGNLIEIDNNTEQAITEKSVCSLCGKDYNISLNYPTSSIQINGKTLKKGEVCYACDSTRTKVTRCDPNTGIKGGVVSLPAELKQEICPTDKQLTAESQTFVSVNSKIPLQLSEEEQIQYLNLGEFTEINNKISDQSYNYGYNGKINDNYSYFSSLIPGIKLNPDEYGSTILFTSDYLKAINQLVKNSRDKSNNHYLFEDFILETSNSINLLYILANISENKNTEDIEKIYSAGKFSEIFASTIFFVKDGTNIKTTKEIRTLINYLAIKRKYLENQQFFSKYDVLQVKDKSKELAAIQKNYEKLDHKYWDTKKNVYLNTIVENNYNLMLKKDTNFYNYDKLLSIAAKPNYPVTYVIDFGQNVYLNGDKYYINPGAHAWEYDTKKEAIENYTLIWEAADICNGKTICKGAVPTTENCCYENKALHADGNHYKFQDILIDGAILGIYNPTSKYNDENREYTQMAIYIGKTISGTPLIAQSTASGQRISILNKETRERIKRIYVPKDTNIKNIKDILNHSDKFPSAYVKLTDSQLKEISDIEKGTAYYENPNLEGEGDLESLDKSKCSIIKQKTLNEYINCLKSNLEMTDLSKNFILSVSKDRGTGKTIRNSGLGKELINSKYAASVSCYKNKSFNDLIFSSAKKMKLTEEETAQLWSKIAAESGCSINCGGNCYGDGVGQVIYETHVKNYSKFKKYLMEIDSSKYSSESKYKTIIKGQDNDPESAVEISMAFNRYNIDQLISKSKSAKKPITAVHFTEYDNDDSIDVVFISSYLYCSPNYSLFSKGIFELSDTRGCPYTTLHKMGYYLGYKRAIYECHNSDTTNAFVEAYKNNYGGTLCK